MATKGTWTLAVGVTLLWTATALWAGAASALDSCKAKVNAKDGTILVGAKGVSGTLLWGNTAGTETNAFADPGCVAGGTASKCTLGIGPVAITPPELCTVYLKDGAAGTCSAFIKKCTPGLRPPSSSGCPSDAVQVGSTCVDKYEASVWQIPDPFGTNTGLVKKVQEGKATLADLTGGGATQISPSSSCTPSFSSLGTFPDNGQWTLPLYAVSIPGVHPTACVTWFQAAQACRLSNKRLPTNLEWQDAAAGTPDPGPDNGTTNCNTLSGTAVNTGSRSGCLSNYGALDMVGNVDEWVADWVPLSTACPGWGAFSSTGDYQCFAGADTVSTGGPGALVRGGHFIDGTGAGPLAVVGSNQPKFSFFRIGFRCAR